MPAKLPLLIAQKGSTPDDLLHRFGDQSDWFRTALGDAARDIRVVHPDLGEELTDVSEFSAAVITGSWSMVTDRADRSEENTSELQSLMGISYDVLWLKNKIIR